jgi:hypothetical protein
MQRGSPTGLFLRVLSGPHCWLGSYLRSRYQKSNVKPILASRAASTEVGVSHAVVVGL